MKKTQARKKVKKLRNSEFKKLTAGFHRYHKGQVGRNKSRQQIDTKK